MYLQSFVKEFKSTVILFNIKKLNTYKISKIKSESFLFAVLVFIYCTF